MVFRVYRSSHVSDAQSALLVKEARQSIEMSANMGPELKILVPKVADADLYPAISGDCLGCREGQLPISGRAYFKTIIINTLGKAKSENNSEQAPILIP
eukprot:5873443-Pyramimonas_sp.AAC.1